MDPAAWNSVVFFGRSGAYAETLLEGLHRAGHRVTLVVEGVDRRPRPLLERHRAPSHRRSKAPSSLIRAAHTLGIDALRTDDVAVAKSRIGKVDPAGFVVAGFPQLIPSAVLSLARRGGLNVHPGRLPEQRGPAPIFWALKRGESLAVTIHRLTEREDAGEVVSTVDVEPKPSDSYEKILLQMAEASVAPLQRAVRDLLRGELVCSPQSEDRAHRDPLPKFKDGRLNPDRDARELFRFVSACAERHSLYVESAKDRFFVLGARGVRTDLKLPGEYFLEGDRLLLSCEGGVLELVLKPNGALFSPDQ